jgi:hypothetical protein
MPAGDSLRMAATDALTRAICATPEVKPYEDLARVRAVIRALDRISDAATPALIFGSGGTKAA